MLNGWWRGQRAGSGTVLWWARQELAAGRIDNKDFIDVVASSAPSIGHCNTMGTASTMNALAEALGMSLPGCAAIGGSANAPIHINAIARHVGVKLTIEDWETIGLDVPLLVDMQPAGQYLGEEYYRAGGLPTVMNELMKAG